MRGWDGDPLTGDAEQNCRLDLGVECHGQEILPNRELEAGTNRIRHPGQLRHSPLAAQGYVRDFVGEAGNDVRIGTCKNSRPGPTEAKTTTNLIPSKRRKQEFLDRVHVFVRIRPSPQIGSESSSLVRRGQTAVGR